MSIRSDFKDFATANGGNRYKYSQRQNLATYGAQGCPGICQALVFFDGLLALSGMSADKADSQEITEYSVHFQQDFEKLRGLSGYNPARLRAKYLECLGYLEYSKLIKIGFVVNAPAVGDVTGFLTGKSGHFNLLLPSHVVGYFSDGADHRYLDPNLGSVSFPSRADALAFIGSYHASRDFAREYDTAAGDTMIVQMTNA